MDSRDNNDELLGLCSGTFSSVSTGLYNMSHFLEAFDVCLLVMEKCHFLSISFKNSAWLHIYIVISSFVIINYEIIVNLIV